VPVSIRVQLLSGYSVVPNNCYLHGEGVELMIETDGRHVILHETWGDLKNGVVKFFEEPRAKTLKPKKIRRASIKQEREIMKGLGGRVQPGSGSKGGYKGDGRVYDQLRVEAKYTTAKSYRLNHSDLTKIRGECEGRERPALVLDFKEKGTLKTHDRWVVIPYADWEKYAAANDK
jgi:hypothetical protein